MHCSSVVEAVTDVASLKAGDPANGQASDGSIADAIVPARHRRQIPPTASWEGIVTEIGVAAKTELQQANLADIASQSAKSLQMSNASVDLDEENVNLLSYQHAYQGAARVMTAIDEMLDTLINRTGLVGR